jgi:DNA-directed RNA polymerase alpha subunit
VLLNEGYVTPSDIIKADTEDLLKLPGFGEKKTQTIEQAAKDFVQQQTDVTKKATASPPQEG